MGCWNTTCGISNLPIHCGEEVVVFLLTQNWCNFMQDFVNGNTYFDPCLLPFYGNYNDYGAVEECHGVGLPVLIEALQSKLHEMGQGENKYHDIPAQRSGLTIEKVFDLDHEDRFFIDYEGKQLKTVHVQIKKSIFDYILKNWEIEAYTGKDFKRKFYKFDAIEEDLDKAIKKIEKDKHYQTLKKMGLEDLRDFDPRYDVSFGMLHERLGNPLFSVRDARKHKDSRALLGEMLKGGFINCFMDATRRPWIKPIGNGSQNDEAAPYHLLCQAITETLDKEASERDTWDD